MNRIIFLFLLVLSSSVLAGDLKLKIHGAGVEGKLLYVAVHFSAVDFPMRDENAIKTTVLAKGDITEIIMPNIPNGEYAVAVFADMNGNGKLDKNFIGIPNEPVGLSRDAKGSFGPPKFSDAVFKLSDGITIIAIELK